MDIDQMESAPIEASLALPYVDELNDATRDKVQRILAAEMEYMRNQRALPPAPRLRFEDSVFLKQEYDRLKKSKGQEKTSEPLDMSRYQVLPPPKEKLNDLSAWKQSVANAQTQLEQESLRILNLELMSKFGPNAWRSYNDGLEKTLKNLQDQLHSTKQHMDEINRERKSAQLAAGASLRQLQEQYNSLLVKNVDIDIECAKLEAENDLLKREAIRRGVLSDASSSSS